MDVAFKLGQAKHQKSLKFIHVACLQPEPQFGTLFGTALCDTLCRIWLTDGLFSARRNQMIFCNSSCFEPEMRSQWSQDVSVLRPIWHTVMHSVTKPLGFDQATTCVVDGKDGLRGPWGVAVHRLRDVVRCQMFGPKCPTWPVGSCWNLNRAPKMRRVFGEDFNLSFPCDLSRATNAREKVLHFSPLHSFCTALLSSGPCVKSRWSVERCLKSSHHHRVFLRLQTFCRLAVHLKLIQYPDIC